ncbi:hypothetical protein MesoLj113c_47110 [Mesorhizobium sp. 113-3-9]|nr:hypothetical protein MesoLj113c_47110 [Mesorhizobium sp. 113-3-9]
MGRPGIAGENLGRDRFTGAPHQADAGDWTGGNRQPVRLAHFDGSKKFIAHGLPIRIRSSIVQFSIRSKPRGVGATAAIVFGWEALQTVNAFYLGDMLNYCAATPLGTVETQEAGAASDAVNDANLHPGAVRL